MYMYVQIYTSFSQYFSITQKITYNHIISHNHTLDLSIVADTCRYIMIYPSLSLYLIPSFSISFQYPVPPDSSSSPKPAASQRFSCNPQFVWFDHQMQEGTCNCKSGLGMINWRQSSCYLNMCPCMLICTL